MSTDNGAGGQELPPGMRDVSPEHPKEIRGLPVSQVLEQECGCRVYYFGETPGVAPSPPESEPCVPHALHQSGMALVAAGARMQKELQAAAEAQKAPLIHRPTMRDYGRGPRG